MINTSTRPQRRREAAETARLIRYQRPLPSLRGSARSAFNDFWVVKGGNAEKRSGRSKYMPHIGNKQRAKAARVSEATRGYRH